MDVILGVLGDIFTMKNILTAGVVVGAMLTLDPALSWLEDKIMGDTKGQHLQSSRIYKTLEMLFIVIAAEVIADRLLKYRT